jgi:hypothetical protein
MYLGVNEAADGLGGNDGTSLLQAPGEKRASEDLGLHEG